jgi:hypothetical protein
VLGDGSVGVPYSVKVQTMDKIFSAALKDVIQWLNYNNGGEYNCKCLDSVVLNEYQETI